MCMQSQRGQLQQVCNEHQKSPAAAGCTPGSAWPLLAVTLHVLVTPALGRRLASCICLAASCRTPTPHKVSSAAWHAALHLWHGVQGINALVLVTGRLAPAEGRDIGPAARAACVWGLRAGSDHIAYTVRLTGARRKRCRRGWWAAERLAPDAAGVVGGSAWPPCSRDTRWEPRPSDAKLQHPQLQ